MKKSKEYLDKLMCFNLLLVLALFPASVGAQGDKLWNPDGQAVSQASEDQEKVRQTTDGNGGAIIVWDDDRNDNSDIFAQCVDYDGNPLWTIDGIGIAVGPGSQSSPEITHDGAGGAIIIWKESSQVLAQRINAEGVAQWTEGGVPLTTTSAIAISITSDMAGGAFIALDTFPGPRVVHINHNGSLTAPGLNGVQLAEGSILAGVTDDGYPFIISDGSGGAFVTWSAAGPKNMAVQRVIADLSLPWGSEPKRISNDLRKEVYPTIASDGLGGAVISWVRQPDVGSPSTTQVVVQRIDEDGNFLWTSGGVVLVDSGTVGGSQDAWEDNEVTSAACTDGLGGAFIVWNDWRNKPGTGGFCGNGIKESGEECDGSDDACCPGSCQDCTCEDGPGCSDDIFAQLVDASGTPQWNGNGVSVHPSPGGSQRQPKIVSDGDGGAVVTIQDMGNESWDIFAIGLDVSGMNWFSYVYYDFPPPVTDQTAPVILFDGTGPAPVGAIIAWVDGREDSPSWGTDIYAQKLSLGVDIDNDGNPDENDNCPETPNGPDGGTCIIGKVGDPCMSHCDCALQPPFCVLNSCSMNQEDDDGDGVGDVCDNCPETPNGPDAGTCVRIVGDTMVSGYQVGGVFIICDEDADCADTGGICQMEQGNYNSSGCGDVCECEGNFDGDLDVDGIDALTFKADFGRRDCEAGTPCNGNFNCDSDVDGSDAIMFKIDFGRSDCPSCSFSCF